MKKYLKIITLFLAIVIILGLLFFGEELWKSVEFYRTEKSIERLVRPIWRRESEKSIEEIVAEIESMRGVESVDFDELYIKVQHIDGSKTLWSAVPTGALD